MRCVMCSGQFVTIKGDLELIDKILGNLIVLDTEYEECVMCGKKLYSPVTMLAIEKAEDLKKKKLLLKKSLEEFILATEVAQILDCSRQAVSKHKRIRRGFIHFVKHNGKFYYLKESVELYKETGDGRLQLEKPIKKSNMVDFSKYHEIKQIKQKTKCVFDAMSDSPCVTDLQETRS